MDWKQVLGRTDLIGGFFATCESQGVIVGPLASMRAEGGRILLASEKCVLRDQTGSLTEWPVTAMMVNNKTEPKKHYAGGIWFQMADGGKGILFPKGVIPSNHQIAEGARAVAAA